MEVKYVIIIQCEIAHKRCSGFACTDAFYNRDEMFPEDYIKARLNSNYAKYFDKDLYLDKKYYYHLSNYKNIYFKYINGEINDLESELVNNNKKIKEYKKKSINKKMNLSWKEYKGVIDRAIDNIFKNYIPMDVKIERDEFTPNIKLDWDEDNYIIKYVNKSIQGEIINFINEERGIRVSKFKTIKCEVCGKLIKYNSKKIPKYCSECAKEVDRKKSLERWKYKTSI